MCYSEPITNYFSTCSATANAEFQTPFANLGTSYLGVPLQSSQLKGVGGSELPTHHALTYTIKGWVPKLKAIINIGCLYKARHAC